MCLPARAVCDVMERWHILNPVPVPVGIPPHLPVPGSPAAAVTANRGIKRKGVLVPSREYIRRVPLIVEKEADAVISDQPVFFAGHAPLIHFLV